MQQMEEVWKQLEGAVTNGQNVSALSLCTYLTLSATLALYIRWLYQKCSASSSDTESISRVFPLLALVTTGVIAVVKSSLALSLGLVGALSIVRFRAAIKDPEELVYLFLCIGIGLALGAEQPLLAIALVCVATVFVVGMHFASRSQRQHRLLLTITGDAEPHFSDGEASVMSAVETVAGRYTLQRFDIENGRGQVRIVLGDSSPEKTAELIARLRERLPDCDLSYVNLNSTL
ncbi:MAG: DUF4956 domain-containing protein [Pirellulaceae bacterium]|jgi:hypothetical protein|nr:DUF4956 domain-containing protein [Pirellulaceae bacterium]